MRHALTSGLRTVRRWIGRAGAVTLDAFPSLEPAFVRGGRWLNRRSRVLGTLYWHTQEEMLPRLRRSNRRYRSIDVAGFDVTVDVTDSLCRIHYFYDEPYEPELSRAVTERLRPGDVFVDIGANVGFFAVLAARCVGPAGRVIAFEPHPEAAALLRRAVALNGVADRIEIVEAAVGATAGNCRLFLCDDSVLSTADPSRSPVRSDYHFSRAIDVPQVTVDGWLAAHAELIPRIRAIKIDVEGTEADVLEGMRATLRQCPGAALLCETKAGSPGDLSLQAQGYVVSALDGWRGDFGNYRYERPATDSAPAGRSSPE